MGNNIVTREGLDNYLTFKDALENKIHEVLNLKCALEDENGRGYVGYIDRIDFEAGRVEVTTIEESRCSCCQNESHYYGFPISYLFDENWTEEVKQKVARRKAEKERKEQEEAERRAKEAEERERREFERLQAKFGKGEQDGSNNN